MVTDSLRRVSCRPRSSAQPLEEHQLHGGNKTARLHRRRRRPPLIKLLLCCTQASSSSSRCSGYPSSEIPANVRQDEARFRGTHTPLCFLACSPAQRRQNITGESTGWSKPAACSPQQTASSTYHQR